MRRLIGEPFRWILLKLKLKLMRQFLLSAILEVNKSFQLERSPSLRLYFKTVRI